MEKDKHIEQTIEVIMILDKSGSMCGIAQEIINNFNMFLKTIRDLRKDINLTLCLFDHNIKTLCQGINIDKAKELDSSIYMPTGMSAINDAISTTFHDTINRLSKLDGDSKVIVFIVTDGMENSSREYTQDHTKQLIIDRQQKGWSIFYIALDKNAYDYTEKLSISDDKHRLLVSKSAKGIESIYLAIIKALQLYIINHDIDLVKIIDDIKT